MPGWFECLEQDLAREHVDPHRGDERFLRGGAAGRRPARRAAAHLRQPRLVRLLFEGGDLAVDVEHEDAHLGRVGDGHRLRGDGDVGAVLDVRFDHVAEVHAIEMVAREDQVVVGVVAGEVTRRLPHRVGRALKPVGALRCLLGGEHFDEAVRKDVQAIGLRDVPVERRRVELRQHEHPLQAGVQAVADRNVDEAILAADRYGRLGAHVGQRIEPCAAPPSQNQRKHVVHGAI